MSHRLCKGYARIPYSIAYGEILLGRIGGGVTLLILCTKKGKLTYSGQVDFSICVAANK
jgi:hypothetical protein